MQLDEDSQKLTAFIIPGKGQFHWITSPMGLLRCPSSFQRLMEGVLRDIPNVLVYIHDLLVHMDTHEKHLEVLDKDLAQLHKNNLKINLEKCVFRNKEVSYLGFTLEGIKPGKNKLKAIKEAKPPTDIKMIRSCATSFGHTLKTSRSLQHLCSGLHERIQATNPDLYWSKLYRPSTLSRSSSARNW